MAILYEKMILMLVMMVLGYVAVYDHDTDHVLGAGTGIVMRFCV